MALACAHASRPRGRFRTRALVSAVESMASTVCTRVCRLCRALVPSKRAVSLFTTIGIQQQWRRRIENLLDVPVAIEDGLSGYICDKCKLRIVSNEKAAADLKAFKETARCSRSALDRIKGPQKRPKSTSSELGVSPDTSRERPRSKIARKRLDFESELLQYIQRPRLNIYNTFDRSGKE